MKKSLLTIAFLFLLATQGWGATTTWQGDDGTNPTLWNVAANWDTNAVPTAADDVVLTTGNACNINVAAVCRSLNASTYTGTLTHTAGVALTIGDATAGAGNVALAFNSTANMTYTLGNGMTSSISFISTSATVQTINFNGHNTGNVTFNAASNGSWQLTGAWGNSGVNVSQATTLVKGTLDTNNQTCYFGSLVSQNDSSYVRTLTLGSSDVYVYRDSNSGYAVGFYAAGANFTFNCGTSHIHITTTGTYGALFSSGEKTFNTVSFASTGTGASSANLALFYTCTIATLNYTNIAVKTSSIQLSNNLSITSSLNIDGNSSINRVLVASDILGPARTITLGASATCASNSTNVDFRDITMTGGAANERDLSAITGGSGDCCGNTGVTFTTADDWYWNGSGTRNFSDYTYWYDTTNGGGSQMASTRCPLPQDTCYINGDSIDGTTRIDQNMPRIPGINCTNAGTFTFDFDNINQQIYGGLVLSVNVTYNWGGETYYVNFYGRGSYLLTTNGKYVGGLRLYMIGGTLTPTDNISIYWSSIGFSVFNGTFDCSVNNPNVVIGGFNSSGTATRTVKMGNGNWTISYNQEPGGWDTSTITNLTFDAGLSTIYLSNEVSGWQPDRFGTLTYHNLVVATGGGYAYPTSYITISGAATFNDFTINANNKVKFYANCSINTLTIGIGSSVVFTAGTTTTVSSLVATGDAGNLIHIDSTSASAATLSDTTGTNTVHYCHIGETGPVNASGGATWDATDNCQVNTSTGWTTGGATYFPFRSTGVGIGVGMTDY